MWGKRGPQPDPNAPKRLEEVIISEIYGLVNGLFSRALAKDSAPRNEKLDHYYTPLTMPEPRVLYARSEAERTAIMGEMDHGLLAISDEIGSVMRAFPEWAGKVEPLLRELKGGYSKWVHIAVIIVHVPRGFGAVTSLLLPPAEPQVPVPVFRELPKYKEQTDAEFLKSMGISGDN